MTSDIRDAATIILIRHMVDGPRILLGQRGAKAAFMPNVFVFPGGGVEAIDHELETATPLSDACHKSLALQSPSCPPKTLVTAAVRELYEETGLLLGDMDTSQDGTRIKADARAMRFVFRALTPPERPQRFDARFFIADAKALRNDPDALDQTDLELSHLSWLSIPKARALSLPLVTDMVLAEIAEILEGDQSFNGLPFFKMGSGKNGFSRLV